MRRNSILKYLRCISNLINSKDQSKTVNFSGLEGNFVLNEFEEFIDAYKKSNFLAPEAEKGFFVLLDALNDLFDTIEGITENDVKMSIIEWYTSATVASTDIIRAKSKYYNAPAFSNIVISMNMEEAQSISADLFTLH